MASKVYTAKELREAADNFWVGGVICEVKGEDGRVVKHINHDAIIAMLRQAADAMDREYKREKKYEYAIKFDDGAIDCVHSEYPMHSCYKLVRREVGEWKEVKE